MTATTFWESGGTFLAVVTPLVAVPLTVITFYLRSIREHQLSWQNELVRRCDAIESSTNQVRSAIGELERDCVTKEEWLRECMQARGSIERLTELTVRLDATMESVIAGRRGTQAARRERSAGDDRMRGEASDGGCGDDV